MRHAGGGPSHDAAIVGGGPAGLSAALILGRVRRRTVVFDSGEYRNAPSAALHGFLSRDGVKPRDLLREARAQLEPYAVELRDARVTDARRDGDTFEVATDGEGARARVLLIATGVVDTVPAIEGLDRFYGTSVFHCPYCDGWEMRGRPLAAYGRGGDGRTMALSLTQWSDDVVLCTDGGAGLRPDDRAALGRRGVRVIERRLARLEGEGGELARIVFADGESLERRALFFKTGYAQRSDLARRLGCSFTKKGMVKTNRLQGTGVEGLYVIGDAAHDMQLAIVAAAEGAKAGFAANEHLHRLETA